MLPVATGRDRPILLKKSIFRNVTLSLASSKNLFTTPKPLFGSSVTVAALSVG